MAVANVAWALAGHEYRVLVVDWDLEAPGLHRYFRPFLLDKELKAPETEGLIDFVRNYSVAAAIEPVQGERAKNWHAPYAEIENWGMPLRWQDGERVRLGERGEIHFIPAGRQGPEYASNVNTFDWDLFYQRLSGGAFMDTVREKMRVFDFVLIDSRTGISDTSGICTIQMPDILVVCYTLNIQSIEGAYDIAAAVRRQRPEMQILPVATRVEFQEEKFLAPMRRYSRDRFSEFVSQTEKDYFNKMEVPYYTKYAYSERLAAFEDEPGAKGSINSEINQLASYISGRSIGTVELPEPQRENVLREFERAPEAATSGPELTAEKPRIGRILWATVAALLAVSIVLALARQVPTAEQRATLILAAIKDSPVEEQVGALLELSETAEVRGFAKELVARGIPTASISLLNPIDSRFDPSGQLVTKT